MVAAPWRFMLEDIMSGHIVADGLFVKGSTIEDVLSRPGLLRASIPMESSAASILDPGRHALYAVRGSRILQGGPVWDAVDDSDTGTLDMVVDGWLGYWDHRVIEDDRQFTATEQFEIVGTLLADAQDEGTHGAGFDLGITVDYDAASGVLRDRTEDYRPWKAKNLGEAIRQLAACEDGFDMSMRYAVVADRITKTLVLHHPTKGRDTGHLFEGGASGNIASCRRSRSARKMAWSGTAWGDGADEARLSYSFTDESKRGVYPPLQAAPGFSGVTVAGTLAENAASTFERLADVADVPVISVRTDRDPRPGAYDLGDTIRVRYADRSIQIGTDTHGPRSFRIIGTKETVGATTVAFALDEAA